MVSSYCRRALPTVARLCLTATFLEDALRLCMQFVLYLQTLQIALRFPLWLSLTFVVLQLVGQLLGSVLVLLRVRVSLAVSILAGLVLLQVHLLPIPWQHFILRNFALLGGLLLLHVESLEAAAAARHSADGAGVPLRINRRPQHLKLTGRLLLACMYLTLLRLEFNPLTMAFDGLGMLLMALIVLGFRTRPAALLLALILILWNLYENSWWLVHDDSRDFTKYNHFHTLSVVGGLLMLVVLGPGEVSLEQYKKEW